VTTREDVYTGKTIPEVIFDTIERSPHRSRNINPTVSFSQGAGNTGPGKIIGNWEYQMWLGMATNVVPKRGDCNPIGATLVGIGQIAMVMRPMFKPDGTPSSPGGKYRQADKWELAENGAYDISEICHMWHGHAYEDPPCDPPSNCCDFYDEGPYWTTDDPEGVTDMPKDGQSNSSFSLDISALCGSTHTTKLIVHSSDQTETVEATISLGAATTGGEGSLPPIEDARSSNTLWNNFIQEATDNATLSPFVYKQVIRSLISTFGMLHYLDGENKLIRVKSTHSAPERAVAKKFQENNIILPIITVHQLTAKSDEGRRRYDNVLIQSTEWNEDIQRAERVISRADVPVNITYSVNLWTKYMEDMDQISQNIRVKFNPSLKIVTPFTDNLKVFLRDESNSSTLVDGDREDRLLRKSFSIEAELYIPSPRFKVTSTGKIEKVVSEIWLS
jgi:hypothetical protein